MSTTDEYQNEIELRLQELRKRLKFCEIATQIVEQQREVLDMLAQT